MPPGTLLGKSLLLACCGSLVYYGDNQSGDNTTQNSMNSSSESTWLDQSEDVHTDSQDMAAKFDSSKDMEVPNLPSWIAPPSFKKEIEIQLSETEVDIRISLPKTNEGGTFRNESKIITLNKTFLDGSNIIQINIYHNGSLVSYPTNISTQNASSAIPHDSSIVKDNSKKFIQISADDSLMPHSDQTQKSALPWWKTSIVYQVYPRSFKDESGSGTGDLKGITSKADYFTELGIGIIWVSPFYVSPMADFGYDIADFKNIDPIFGTLEDFDLLLKEMHARDIKVIVDFVPNHSSDQHDWFKKSVEKVHPFTDYYVWKKAKGFNETGHPIPPNNWLSRFGFSAWEWSEERQEFYLHQFLKEQPDLNVRNPFVMNELDDILRFWLDRGVDGFRIDALKFLFEVENTDQDEPIAVNSDSGDTNEYFYLNHTLTINRPETVEAVGRWRKITDEYHDRIIIVEVYDRDIREIMKYYGNDSHPLSHFPFNFYLITELNNRSDITGHKLKQTLDIWLDNMEDGNWPNWVLGNHDRGRVATRLGRDICDALNMLILLLPGTPTSYYGEEIGMEDTYVTFDEAKDPFGLNFGPDRYIEFGRDPERSPMQWDDSINAGFSKANSTWLPINSNYKSVNAKAQMNSKQSHLKVYRQLAQLRKEETFTQGNLTFPLVDENVLVFKRALKDAPCYIILINTSEKPQLVDLTAGEDEEFTKEGEIVLRSSFDNRKETTPGSTLLLSSIALQGGEGIVLRSCKE